jgi:hypothetical protein
MLCESYETIQQENDTLSQYFSTPKAFPLDTRKAKRFTSVTRFLRESHILKRMMKMIASKFVMLDFSPDPNPAYFPSLIPAGLSKIRMQL